MSNPRAGLASALCFALLTACGPVSASTASLDLHNTPEHAAWAVVASDQVQARLKPDARGGLCLHYDFAGVSGYAVMRREWPQAWPTHFDLTARIKGTGGVNDLQLKLVDASGDNVWWVNRSHTALPKAWSDVRLRERHLSFAWGPSADKRLRRTQFVELVIAAGRDGGRGVLCLQSLALAEREADPAVWPEPALKRVSGLSDGLSGGLSDGVSDGLLIDLHRRREFNGLQLRWPEPGVARSYRLSASDDGRHWRLMRSVHGASGAADSLFLPETQARFLKLSPHPPTALPQPPAAGAAGWPAQLPTLSLKSAADWPTLNAVTATRAAALPRGHVPRAFIGQQNYWTLVGVDGGGQRSALLSEDGALEIGRGGYSLEPVLRLADGRVLTWADVQTRHTLLDQHLPLPSVHWQHAAFNLSIDAAADGPREAPALLARYRLLNTTAQTQTYTLGLMLRPWQVNPPQQFLSTPGGMSPVRSVQMAGAELRVNQGLPLRFTQAPLAAAARPWDADLSLAAAFAPASPAAAATATASTGPAPITPAAPTLRDAQGYASMLLQWQFTLAPGAQQVLGFAAPLGPAHTRRPTQRLASGPVRAQPAPLAAQALDQRFTQAAAQWRERLNAVSLTLPPEAQAIGDSLRTALAHMLISRDGPALRPGTRSYARTWVRDGAMMAAGLVRMGEREAAREFIDWYRPYVFASGKVPCCVDQRGADPVVENDSHGQYLFSVAEVLRHGGGTAWAATHWPTVQRVVRWLEALRQSERTAANRTAERQHLFGLMPPSISHEGYSDKPAYSHWDNFWALRGYKDAAFIARQLGHAALAEAWAAAGAEFEGELAASIEATKTVHGIGFIPGAADRGDFDATSTTVALNPAQARLPGEVLQATFERYWQEMSARSEGRRAWADYTPYELRTVGALARLQQPERAHHMLAFFFRHQRPRGWNGWAEVVLPDEREPRFLGDMPHAWVSSDYVRSALDLFAFDDEHDDALILGAGWLPAWLQQPELALSGLSTPYGRLDLRLLRQPGGWTLHVPLALRGVQGLRRGLVLRWPAGLALPVASHEGRSLAWVGRELVLPAPPVLVELREP